MELKTRFEQIAAKPYFKAATDNWNKWTTTLSQQTQTRTKDWRFRFMKGYRRSVATTKASGQKWLTYIQQHSGEWVKQFRQKASAR